MGEGRRAAAWARLGAFYRAVRVERGWSQAAVADRRMPSGERCIGETRYQQIEKNRHPDGSYPKPATLRRVEIALMLEPGTSDVVLASANHGLNPRKLPYYIVEEATGEDGQTVYQGRSHDWLTDAQRRRVARRIADASSPGGARR